MTRIQNLSGIIHILWGLILIIPLSIHFSQSDATILIPLILVFILTGIGVVNNKTIAWTFALVLGFLVLIHFVISIDVEANRSTDVRRGTQEVVLFLVWSTMAFLTLYSTLGLLRKDMRMKLGIQSSQFKVTMVTCLVTGVLWSIFLLNNLN